MSTYGYWVLYLSVFRDVNLYGSIGLKVSEENLAREVDVHSFGFDWNIDILWQLMGLGIIFVCFT